jgi:hypothetical protein
MDDGKLDNLETRRFGNVKNHQVNSNALVGNSFESLSVNRFVLHNINTIENAIHN